MQNDHRVVCLVRGWFDFNNVGVAQTCIVYAAAKKHLCVAVLISEGSAQN